MSKPKITKFEVESAHTRICYMETENDLSYTPEGVQVIMRSFIEMCKELEAISTRGALNNE